MVVTRQGFTQVVANSFVGMGFPAEGPSIHEFPMAMFNNGSDLTPINQNIDKVVYGLTKWQPKITSEGVFLPPMVTVRGKNYQDALKNLNGLFLKSMWSDGLQITPPTKEQVDWILTGTDLAHDRVIADTVVPRGGIATVESIAVVLAMAGGRPEYLPVLIASVAAITDPAWGLEATNPTTCSVIPAIIVNGPIARQIRLGSGYGMLGPDPAHPAGTVIGRALRLVQQDLGGAIPGIGTMAIFGGMRATNAVFAEDEEGLPKDWTSLAEDRGFAKTDNVITATPISSMVNDPIGFGTKETNNNTLVTLAQMMRSPDGNISREPNNSNLAAGIAMIARGTAGSLSEVSGYSKLDVKKFLWEHSKTPWADMLERGMNPARLPNSYANLGLKAGDALQLTPKPEQITLVVAGGDQSGHIYWMQVGHSNHTMVSQKVQLPKNWNALLKQAETDLGPLPATH